MVSLASMSGAAGAETGLRVVIYFIDSEIKRISNSLVRIIFEGPFKNDQIQFEFLFVAVAFDSR